MIDSLPVASQSQEICLTTLDSDRRVGFPLCIPIRPQDLNSEIGPLLLSPTVSLTRGDLIQSQDGEFMGKTIPDSKVNISFFDSDNSLVGFIPEALASDMPVISTYSDLSGIFRVKLSTQRIARFHVFAKGYYEEMPTLKSQTLVYSVSGALENWIRYALPWILLILLLVIVIYYMIKKERKTGVIQKNLINYYEKRLLPLVAKRHLLLRRLWYNLRDFLRKYHI